MKYKKLLFVALAALLSVGSGVNYVLAQREPAQSGLTLLNIEALSLVGENGDGYEIVYSAVFEGTTTPGDVPYHYEVLICEGAGENPCTHPMKVR